MSKASLELGGGNWGTKDGNLLAYAQGNESSNLVPREFTFTRGSDIAATRINSSGLIEKYRENLLLQSNQFDTTWTTDGASVTSGQSGYDGSSDAWKLLGTGGSFPRVQQNKSISGVSTFSVYAKAGNVNVLRLLTISGSNTDTKFQLTESGSILTQTGSERIESKITRLGSTDWYRCSITFNGSPTNFRIYPMSDSSTFAVNGEFIYIQDAQLEQGLVATNYLESGATTATSGVADNEPRINYTGGTASLLLEPSRTNLIGYSEYFEGTGWVKESGATIESNVDSSPDGNTNASYLKAPIATNSTIRIKYTFSSTSSQTYVGSIFVKKENVDFIRILSTGATASTLEAFYNVSNGTLGSSGTPSKAIIEDYGNGWYRLSLVIDAVNTSSSATFRVQLAKTDGAVIDNFDGTEKNLIFGGQLEEGSYPTSYIPTYGTSVTRNAESFEKTGLSGVIGQTEGTIFFEFEYFHQKINTPFFRILEDASNLYEIIALSSFKLRSRARIGGSIVASIDTSSVVSEGTHKAAIIYKSGDYKFYLDGSLAGSSTESSIVSNPSEINYFDNNNNLKQFLIFPTTLTDDECIALTTL